MSRRFDFVSPTALKGVRRLATKEERRFLWRYNLVRMWRILLFWLMPLFLLGIIGLLHGLIVWQALEGFKQTTPALLVMLAPLLFLDWVVLKQWGRPLLQALRMRPILWVPRDLQVLEFEAPLHLLVHRTDFETNIFLAGSTLIDIPEHWESEVLRRVNAHTSSGISDFVMAILPGSQNRVIRLPMNRFELPQIKADILLRDIGSIIVGLDQLSIQREVRARLPLLRGHPGVMVIGGLLAVATVLSAMVWQQNVDRFAQKQLQLRDRIAQLSSRYMEGKRIDVSALRVRGFQGLDYMPETNERVVTGAASERFVVARFRQDAPMLISADEMRAIQRVSFLSPRVLPGSGPISPKMIEQYRQRLIARLPGDDTALVRLRAVVQALPQNIVEAQLRALANGSRPAPVFVDGLLPKPFVFAGEPQTSYPHRAVCGRAGQALCRAGAVSWADPAFISDKDGHVYVTHQTEVARLFEQQAELAALQPSRLGDVAKCVAIVSGVMAGMCFLLYGHARWMLRRYWREAGAGFAKL